MPQETETNARPHDVRQGDVYLRAIPRVDPAGQPVPLDHGRVILAYGEATGHAHAVVAVDDVETIMPPALLVEAPDGRRVLYVTAPCVLVHQEHARIALAPGCYEVYRQRQYFPDAVRPIED